MRAIEELREAHGDNPLVARALKAHDELVAKLPKDKDGNPVTCQDTVIHERWGISHHIESFLGHNAKAYFQIQDASHVCVFVHNCYLKEDE